MLPRLVPSPRYSPNLELVTDYRKKCDAAIMVGNGCIRVVEADGIIFSRTKALYPARAGACWMALNEKLCREWTDRTEIVAALRGG
jgi:hypothetical protein